MGLHTAFKHGDQVMHPRRPEWGSGVVREVRPVLHEGTQAQRVAVDFANKGRVVINTAVAPLELKGNGETMSRTTTLSGTEAAAHSGGKANGGGWLGALERATGGTKNELWDLPTPMTDPFASLAQRLEATADSYRFSTDPRSLIDWASAQTGLDDPLSKYTRSELEQAFPRFARDRDAHLKNLVWQLKRRGELSVIQGLIRSTRVPAARAALERASRH